MTIANWSVLHSCKHSQKLQPFFICFAVLNCYITAMSTNICFNLISPYLGCRGRVRLLNEIPQTLLILCELPVSKVLLDFLLDVVGLLLHLLDHVFLSGVELVLTTGLQIDLVDAPIVQIVAEGHHAHLVHHVQFARSVEVQNGVERSGNRFKSFLKTSIQFKSVQLNRESKEM